MLDWNPSAVEGLVETYKALADETRLRMLAMIAERSYNGRELAEALDITQPAVSHHVEKLKRAELLREWREGRERVYGLNRDTLAKLARKQRRLAKIEVESDRSQVLRDFFDGERLKSIPAQRKKRVAVLQELLRRFEPERTYTEREVNELLAQAHEDVATLRRELIIYGFMERERGIYRRAEQPQAQHPNVAQELGEE